MTKEFSTVGVFGKRDSLDYEPLRIIAELLIKSGRQVLLEKNAGGSTFAAEKVSPVTKSAKIRPHYHLWRRWNLLRRFPPHGALRCTLHRY